MKAEYINHMGDDLTVVNAARVSFDKESFWVQRPYKELDTFDEYGEPELELMEEEIKAEYEEYEDWPRVYDDQGKELSGFMLSKKDRKLISYLAKHNHWTPFSHPQITMRETVPIFVARQRFKHMVGFTYNEVSRRYVDSDPEFYTPDAWRLRPDDGIKQGSGNATIPINPNEWDKDDLTNPLHHWHEMALQYYKDLIGRNVAPEQARMILPQSMYTSYYVTGSLAAWARAYKQRIDQHAQKEIRDLAKQWGDTIEPLFPVSWSVLTS